jgi:acyl-CoA synthetase (AMP-forming)/AMP-acid ligase II
MAQPFNACAYLPDQRLAGGDGQRIALAGVAGELSSEDELIKFCRQALPSFKRPRKVVFVSSYPSTATGKIRRVELRRMAATLFVPSDPPTEAVPS